MNFPVPESDAAALYIRMREPDQLGRFQAALSNPIEPFVLADIGYGTVDLVIFRVDQHALMHATTATGDDLT